MFLNPRLSHWHLFNRILKLLWIDNGGRIGCREYKPLASSGRDSPAGIKPRKYQETGAQTEEGTETEGNTVFQVPQFEVPEPPTTQ